MITKSNLEKKQKEMLAKMTDQEVKAYIDNIVKEYYNCIINQDALHLNQCIVNLNNVMGMFEDKDIAKYITFRLITGFNDVLINSSINDFQLMELVEPGLNPSKDKVFRMTKLDRIIDAIFYEKAWKKEREIEASIKTNEDVLNLFNYHDYCNK